MVDLGTLIHTLETIAPPQLAAEWDNVGLLVRGQADVRHIGLCIDLTEQVLRGFIDDDVDAIVAYHPPIFSGLKRLAERTPTERIIATAVRHGLSIYAPHTALDAATGGMNDWLLDGLGETVDRHPIEPGEQPEVGLGRTGRLVEPVDLGTLATRIKHHLGLQNIRLAQAPRWSSGALIRRVAVCPGAGGSLFSKVHDVDLYLTGEMRHHDVLAKIGAGSAVILTDHTNTERGYLPTLATRLRDALAVPVSISAIDADPLRVV